jgi:hypothetical protein
MKKGVRHVIGIGGDRNDNRLLVLKKAEVKTPFGTVGWGHS